MLYSKFSTYILYGVLLPTISRKLLKEVDVPLISMIYMNQIMIIIIMMFKNQVLDRYLPIQKHTYSIYSYKTMTNVHLGTHTNSH